MATTTSKLGLTKPSYMDAADVVVPNNNFDILDREVAKRTRVVNLLDNSDFRNPVNQRGQTSYGATGWNAYTIDRWFLSGSANVTPTAHGVSLEATGFFQWFQPFSPEFSAQYAGTPFTLALCLADGTVYTANGEIPAPGVYYDGPQVPITATGYIFGVYQGLTGGMWARVFCGSAQPAITIKWMALYFGSYTTDTIPEYQPSRYATEIAECQRYLYPLSDDPFVAGYSYGAGEVALLAVRTPEPMRIHEPTLDLQGGSMFIRCNGADYAVTGIFNYGKIGNTVLYSATAPGLPGMHACYAYVASAFSNRVFINAEV